MQIAIKQHSENLNSSFFLIFMRRFLRYAVIMVLVYLLFSHEPVEQKSAVKSCPGKIGNHVQQHAVQDKRDGCDMVLARQTHPLIPKCATAIWDVSVAFVYSFTLRPRLV